MAVDLFKKIDNTVLDLQASQGQTYEGLLEKLAQLLRYQDLQPFNKILTKNIGGVLKIMLAIKVHKKSMLSSPIQ